MEFQLDNISKVLTKETLQDAFREKTKSDDKIVDIRVTSASPPGEGLISAVYRILVCGSFHTTSFVAKGLVADKLLRKSLDCHRLFKREVDFFSVILPTLVQFQKSCGSSERLQRHIPICYACYCDGENDFILLEDLAESGCQPFPPELSVEERNDVLKTLAHLTAVSLALKWNHPKTFDNITNNLEDTYYRKDKRLWYAKYLDKAIDIDKEALSEYEDPFQSIYYKKFLALVNDDVYGQLMELTNPTNTELKAITHGDAWCPNFLRSGDRTVAIDFQLLRTSSPVTDLSYFIMICGDTCRNTKDFEEAVTVFYNSMAYYMNDMNIEIEKYMTFVRFWDEMLRFGKFGLLAALSSIPLRASAERCDTMTSPDKEYTECDAIPLEELWNLKKMENSKDKLKLVNIIRVAVDVGLI